MNAAAIHGVAARMPSRIRHTFAALSFAWLSTMSASSFAQSAHRESLPAYHERLPSIAVDRADGAWMLGTMRATPSGTRVVFDRKNADGTSRWTHATPYDGHVLSVAPMRDGSWLVTGQYNTGNANSTTTGFVIALEDDGRVRWQLTPDAHWVGITPAIASDGRVFVGGLFFRGALQLPGGPRWTSRRRFTHFVAELDAQRGQVRWARLVTGGDEGSYITVTPSNTIVVATHQARKPSGQNLLIQSFSDTGAPLVRRSIAMPGSTYPHAIRALSNGSIAVLTSTEATGTDPTMRLGLLSSVSAEPTWTTLPNTARLVQTQSANAPLEVLVTGAHAGIYDDHLALTQGAQLLTLDPSNAATTREQWLGLSRSIAVSSLSATHGAHAMIALAERDGGDRFTLHVGAPDALITRTNPGRYTLEAHRAAIARAPRSQPMF